MALKNRQKSRAERTEELRQSIIQASMELFVEQGYEKTTTRQILQKVGILNGSLYNIYKSKEEIFADITSRALYQAVTEMEGILGPDAPMAEKLCFIPCFQIHASSRSPRIAELLAIANENWTLRSMDDGYSRRWREAIGHDADNTGAGFEISMLAVTGAQASIYRRMAASPGELDHILAMKTVCRMALDVFGHSIDDLDGLVDRLAAEFGKRTFNICGVDI